MMGIISTCSTARWRSPSPIARRRTRSCATRGSSPGSIASSSRRSIVVDRTPAHDPRDPDPWLALMLDRSLPLADEAKAALIRDQQSRSRQFLLPLVRPLARAMIVVAQLVHTISPRWPNAPRLLHRSIAFGMRRFLTPDANRLILRHFHLGAQI